MVNGLRSAPQRKPKFGTRVLESLERQQWLDRSSYRLEHALTLAFAAFGRRRELVSNALHGTWLGHPVHPALTAVPTGAVATAMALDAASLLPGQSAAMRDASRLALGVGVIGSLGAGDWHDRLAAHPRRIASHRNCAWSVEHRRHRATASPWAAATWVLRWYTVPVSVSIARVPDWRSTTGHRRCR